MDVADVLRCAADAVDRSGMPADLRAVAFTTAVDLVLRTAGEAPLGRGQGSGASPATGTSGSPAGGAPPTAGAGAPAVGGPPLAGAERPAERLPASGLRLHTSETGRDHPALGEPRWEEDEDGGWDVDRRADARADHRAERRADHRSDHRTERRGEHWSDHRGDWPEPPRVLRPLTSAAAQRAGLPRLAPRSGADDGGADWSAPRRGPERLVAVGPRPWPAPAGAGEEPWGSIADALGVRPELLDRVWEERGGKLQLAGDPARLGRTRAQRVGTAAVLLLAALRWSGRDGGEPVPDAVVRAEVERLGLLDTGNYTKHLAGRRHLLSTTGSGRTATYKLRYDGLEEARVIARALLEEG